MTEVEKMIYQVCEFVFVEIDGVENVTYGDKSKGEQNTFTITMDDGTEYTLEIKPK